MSNQELRILSVQSHVTHGFVGNKAATFPLQCLGWDVDVINSVNFSNHTGYGAVEGSTLTNTQLAKITQALDRLSLNRYECFLTGYIPNLSLLGEIKQLGLHLKEKNHSLLWLLDPVMGDEGVMYVDSSVVEAYQDIVEGGKVDIVTPNQFELQLLLGFPVETEEAIGRALEILHNQYNIKYVVVTLMFLKGDTGKLLQCYSTQGSGEPKIIEINPVIEGYYTGVGDLFAALLLDKIYKSSDGRESLLGKAVSQVNSIMRQVLRTTSERSLKLSGESTAAINTRGMKLHELDLVSCVRFFA